MDNILDHVVVQGQSYDIVSPTAFGDNIETIGSACINPDGYAQGSTFLAKFGNEQFYYEATAAITQGSSILEGTNCKKTTVTGREAELASEIETLGETVDSLNEALSNEVETRAILGAHQFLDIDINVLKSLNTAGTWVGNEFTHTASGVKFTVNSDLSIAVSGTASGSSGQFVLGVAPKFPVNETMNLSGVLSGASGLYIVLSNSVSISVTDSGSGADFLSNDFDVTTYPNSACYIYVDNGATVSATVKPLIKLATDPSTTYTPYAMTNRELTEKVTGLIKSNTFSGTTSASGALQILEDTTKKKIVIAALFNGNEHNGIVISNSTSYANVWFIRAVTTSNGVVVPEGNVSVSGTYYYIEL